MTEFALDVLTWADGSVGSTSVYTGTCWHGLDRRVALKTKECERH